jgi:hypothetical protein
MYLPPSTVAQCLIWARSSDSSAVPSISTNEYGGAGHHELAPLRTGHPCHHRTLAAGG